MRTQFLKRLSTSFCLVSALLGLNHRATAQLSVGPGGLATQAFSSAPAVSQFSTRSVGPVVAGGAVSSGAQMDTVIQTNTAASINVTLPTSSTVPPAASGFAQWNSTDLYLQTRANTNWYTALMATLQNNTGSNIVILNLSYDFATVVTAGTTIIEQIPGLRAYYSLTGAENSWVHIPGFDSPGATNTEPKSAALNLGGWAAGATLYILWVDANGTAGAAQEGGYTLDNLRATAVPEQPGPPQITVQPQSQTVGFPNQVVFTVAASGSTPFFYQWRKNGVAIAGATDSSYTIVNATLADQGAYSVVVSNSLNTATSVDAILTVTCAGGTTGPSITTQPADQSVNSGGTISLSVVATGTSLRYQWYRNGSPIAGATAATYTKTSAQPTESGLYSVRIANCANSISSDAAVVSVADASYVVLPLNKVWKYEESNTDLGTAWRATTYNDSTANWKSGAGVLGIDPGGAIAPLIATTLTLQSGGVDIPTHYFRTTFVLTNDPSTVTLVSSNYFDDGCVVYVNGVEAFRVNMSSGNVGFSTLANATDPPGGEGTFYVTNLPPSLLVQGTNFVAAEVHQVNLTSSDTDWGMAVIVRPVPSTLISITNQPDSIAVEETHPATFTVGAQGQPQYYRWYKEGVGIPVATSNPFTIPSVSPLDAGNYYVVVSNLINSVTSSVVTLTVLQDTNGPVLVDADGTISNTTVLVSFSESVLASTATNIANYRITNITANTGLTISKAVLTNGTNVLLTTAAARVANNNYLLVVNNVRDISPRQNVIVPNSMIPIRSLATIISLADSWRYYDPYPEIGDAPNLGTAWKEFSYVETNSWGEGPTILYYGDPSAIPGPEGALLSQTTPVTSYFRKGFNFQSSLGGLQLFLTHVFDDGAIVYLNGTEVFRFNMPEGTVNYDTPASTIVADPSRIGPIPIPANTLRAGSNVIAVELHQNQTVDVDKYFGIQVDASVQSFAVGPVIITSGPANTTAFESSPVTFTVVQAGGSTFQWKQITTNNVTSNIPGATNDTFTIPNVNLTNDAMRYFVAVSNATSGAVSTNATLRVVPDVTRPTIVAAYASPNSIVVSFSENVTAASAQTTANYTVTNGAGAAFTVTGALLSNGTNVALSFASLPFNTYYVVVRNIRDTSISGNTILSNSWVKVGSQSFLAFTNSWKYNQSNTDLGTTWSALNYNDGTWPSGNALFAAKNGTIPTLPVAVGTVLNRTNNGTDTKTYYFRQHFSSYGSGAGTVSMRMVVDDGCIVYLNGAEIYRLGMPAGAVTYTTLASRTQNLPPNDSAPIEGIFTVPVANLVGGDNVIAVEVHEVSAGSSDMYWAGEFKVSIDPTIFEAPTNAPPVCTYIPPTTPRLNYQRAANGTNVVLSWSNPVTNNCGSNAVFTLQQTLQLANPPSATVWQNVTSTTPHTAVGTNSTRFFRLKL